jgi:gas vesicle protein
MNTTTKIIGGFLAGATLGVAAGLLLAPNSGQKTRKKIMKESKKLTDQFTNAVSQSLDTVKKSYNKKLDEYADNGKTAIENVKKTIKA